MKKRKITVLSATVLLAIVAFPLLSSAATTEAPVLSVESFVMGNSGLQMNLQLAPDGSIVPGGASVGPAYVPPPSVATACPPNDYCVEDCSIFDTSCNTDTFYCPDLATNPPTDLSCPVGSSNPSWHCTYISDSGTVSCDWSALVPDPDLGTVWSSCTDGQDVTFTSPSCSVPPPPVACPTSDYCFDECDLTPGDAIECGVNYYCPDLADNPYPGPGDCEWSGPYYWECGYEEVSGELVVVCRWQDSIENGCTDFVETASCSVPPINTPIINAAAVAAPASFETLPISDIRGSLVCTNCNPTTNICDPANCKTREFVERNIMEEYEGSCTYKYTTTTGQTVTKRITGKPPACP